jgi:hypothetical protein
MAIKQFQVITISNRITPIGGNIPIQKSIKDFDSRDEAIKFANNDKKTNDYRYIIIDYSENYNQVESGKIVDFI